MKPFVTIGTSYQSHLDEISDRVHWIWKSYTANLKFACCIIRGDIADKNMGDPSISQTIRIVSWIQVEAEESDFNDPPSRYFDGPVAMLVCREVAWKIGTREVSSQSTEDIAR